MTKKSFDESFDQEWESAEDAILDAGDDLDEDETEDTLETGESEAAEGDEIPDEGDPVAEDENPEPEATQAEGDGEYNEPPLERWPNEWKEAYNALPSSAKKHFMEGFKHMQRSHNERMQQIAHMRRSIEPYLNVVQRHQEAFQRMGVAPEVAFEQQLAWAAHIQQVGMEQGLKDWAAAHRIDPAMLAQQQQAEDEGYWTPNERKLLEENRAVTEKLSQVEQALQGLAHQEAAKAQAARVQEVSSHLQHFLSETDSEGHPAHPHIDRVKGEMSRMIQTGYIPAVDEQGNRIPDYHRLKMAYERAVYADPELRATLAQSNASSNIEERRRQAARAQRAARQVVDKTGGGVPKAPKSFEEDFDAQWDRAANS